MGRIGEPSQGNSGEGGFSTNLRRRLLAETDGETKNRYCEGIERNMGRNKSGQDIAS